MDSYYDSEEADVADIIRKLELRRAVSSYPEISTQCQNELCRCQHCHCQHTQKQHYQSGIINQNPRQHGFIGTSIWSSETQFIYIHYDS